MLFANGQYHLMDEKSWLNPWTKGPELHPDV